MSNCYRPKRYCGVKEGIIDRSEYECRKLPNQFVDFITCEDTRFNEICEIYLQELTMCDIPYLKPKDLINLVPPTQYNHKLLMSILVRKYIFVDCCNNCDKKCDGMCNKKYDKKCDKNHNRNYDHDDNLSSYDDDHSNNHNHNHNY